MEERELDTQGCSNEIADAQYLDVVRSFSTILALELHEGVRLLIYDCFQQSQAMHEWLSSED